jgi:hypothetical protein
MYYIKVDKDKINELRKDENWTSVVELKKGNYNMSLSQNLEFRIIALISKHENSIDLGMKLVLG